MSVATGAAAPPIATSPREVLRHGDFARVWTANVVSDIGTWMQLVTIGTLVAGRTGSALQTGLVAVATFAPQGLASPIAGMLADRYDRRRLYLMVLAGQAIAASILAAAVRADLSSRTLTLIVLAQGVVGSASNPVAAAMLPDLVPRRMLLAASSLQAVSWNSGRIAGPILASVLLGAVGATWAIVANAVSFAVLFVAIAGLRRSFPPAATDTDDGVMTRLRQGAAALRATPTAVFSWQVGMVGQVLIAPMIGLAPIIATRSLGGDRSTVSALLVAMGVGSIIGSLSVSRLVARFGRSRTAVGLMSIACALMVVYGQSRNVVLAVTCIFFLGMTFIAGHITMSSIVPRDSPAAARGRIASIYSATVGLCYGIGVTWMGALGDVTSLHTSMTIGGLTAALLLAASVWWRRDRWRSIGLGDRVGGH